MDDLAYLEEMRERLKGRHIRGTSNRLLFNYLITSLMEDVLTTRPKSKILFLEVDWSHEFRSVAKERRLGSVRVEDLTDIDVPVRVSGDLGEDGKARILVISPEGKREIVRVRKSDYLVKSEQEKAVCRGAK